MSTVYKWEVFCETAEEYKSVWSPTTPTTCPDNNTHTISPNPKIIQTVSNKDVKIIEENDGVTQGFYKMQGFKQTIDACQPGNVFVFDHIWPYYPITIINGWFMAKSENEGDMLHCTVADDTIIGAITAPVFSGNTVISVTDTVIQHIAKGYRVNITDGVNLNDLGQVVSKTINTITVSSPAQTTFSPLSPTYVRMTADVIENLHIPIGKQRYAFAEKKMGGKYLPAGIPLKIKYINQDGNAKTFAYNMEYLY